MVEVTARVTIQIFGRAGSVKVYAFIAPAERPTCELAGVDRTDRVQCCLGDGCWHLSSTGLVVVHRIAVLGRHKYRRREPEMAFLDATVIAIPWRSCVDWRWH